MLWKSGGSSDLRLPDACHYRKLYSTGVKPRIGRAFAQRFQSRMIQRASVMFSHATKELRAFHSVKKMFSYLWTN
jgi:hypothetical protein